jgi:uncharacterized delta-60 repeat protein
VHVRLLGVLVVLAVGCGDDAGGGNVGTTSTDASGTSAPSTTVTPTTSSSTTATDTTDASSGSESGSSSSTGVTTGGEEMAELWTFTRDGADSDDDEVRGLAVDGEGNIYAAGIVTEGGPRAWVIQLDPEGNEVWTYTITDASEANAIALLPGGDVVIAGSATIGGLDVLVSRINEGGEVWTQTYDGPGSLEDVAVGVVVDGAGDIVVVGSEDAAMDDSDVWIRKYDPDGGEVWTTIHAGKGMLDDAGFGVAVDGNDNVVVAGFVDADATTADGFVARYDSGGVEDWFTTIAVDEFQVMRSVAVDGDDNVLATGRVGADTLSIFVAKYDASGAEQWNAMHLESGGPDYGRSVAVDAAGDAYVAGYVNNPGHFLDLWGRKYTADGGELWSIAYRNEEAMLDDAANAIAVDADGNVIVGGFESVVFQSHDAWIRKYSQG